MLTEFLQERAALYISGAMEKEQREEFELMLEFHEELRGFVAELREVGAAIAVAAAGSSAPTPDAALKARICGLIRQRPQQITHEALVVSGTDGLVQWVNPAFSEMCGYSLEELRGKKLGPILQGAETDRAAADRIRAAVLAAQPCRETIVNYHKNGTPYVVDIHITPIVDDAGAPLWLVAREREVPAQSAA
jgi:PAS domain S-box-containing protein